MAPPSNFSIEKYCNQQCQRFSAMNYTKKATQPTNARMTEKMRYAMRARLMSNYK